MQWRVFDSQSGCFQIVNFGIGKYGAPDRGDAFGLAVDFSARASAWR